MTVEFVFVFKPHSNSLGIKKFHGDLPVWVDIKPIHYPHKVLNFGWHTKNCILIIFVVCYATCKS